ncbi:E3 ubiquitin-protein ligase RGLG1, partial [Camellia lanceoleosa]
RGGSNAAGPTSFGPIIEMAMTIVEKSGGQYHHHSLLIKPSNLPIGVGDGPWDMMREFDDNIPARAFDNFQFVNFTEIMSKNVAQSRKETEFALASLMEIPSQYKATIELNILGGRKGNVPERVPLPPPVYSAPSFSSSKSSCSSNFQQSSAPYHGHSSPISTAPPASSSTFDNQVNIGQG